MVADTPVIALTARLVTVSQLVVNAPDVSHTEVLPEEQLLSTYT